MSVVIVIPARHASTRYPGKPLVPLTGASGQARALIRRSWDAAMQVAGADRVIVATDDDRDPARACMQHLAAVPDDARRLAELLSGGRHRGVGGEIL